MIIFYMVRPILAKVIFDSLDYLLILLIIILNRVSIQLVLRKTLSSQYISVI